MLTKYLRLTIYTYLMPKELTKAKSQSTFERRNILNSGLICP